MKTQTIIILILLCSLAHTATAKGDVPARDYTMIDVGNGLTSKLLDIGTTSFTFSVEWPLDMKFETGIFFLYGSFDKSDPWWHPVADVRVDPSQGKATFEIPYNWLLWYHVEPERTKFKQKAFFHFGVVDPNDTGWDGTWPDDEEEAQNGTGIKQGGAVGAEKSNRLGFYVGIVILLSAVFYLVRRKTRN